MSFNPEDLLHTEAGGANSTKAIPVPVGEFLSQCGKPSVRQNTIKKGPNAGEMLTFLDVPLVIQDEDVKEETKRDKPQVRWSTILTLDENNQISTEEGDNIQLGRLREAIGMNDDPSFTLAAIEGQMVMARVSQRPDDDDPETIYNDVKGVRAPD